MMLATRRAFVATLAMGLSLGLLTTAQFSSAQASCEVSVVRYDVDANLNKVPSSLPWSRQGLADAKKAIRTQASSLQTFLNHAKNAGATSVRMRQLPELTSPVTHYLKAKASLTNFYLVAFDDNGKQIDRWRPHATFSGHLSRLMIRLNVRDCSLTDFNLFKPGSWSKPSCKVVQPTAPKYLKYALIEQLMYGHSRDLIMYVQGQLEYIAQNNLAYTVQDGQIICPGLASYTSGATAINLKLSSVIDGYEIKISPSGDFTLSELPPDLVAMAKAARQDSTGLIKFFNFL
jgi:hypothetical protein